MLKRRGNLLHLSWLVIKFKKRCLRSWPKKADLKVKRFHKVNPKRKDLLKMKQLIQTWNQVTGDSNKTRNTIGSWRSIILTSWTNIWEEWIRFLRLWLTLLKLDKLNNVEVIIKRWKRNITHSVKFSWVLEIIIMELMTLLPLKMIFLSLMFL